MIFKRIISTITGAALLTSYMSILAGCSMKEFFSNESKSDPPSSADDGTLSNAEWLSMVNDAFGMQVDENAEDGELDAAKTWGVIGEDEKIDMNAPVDDKFVTTTLMRAAGFATPESTDEEVIQAAIEHGVLTDANASVANPEQAIQSLSKAQNEWMNQEFEEHRNIDLVDGVQNFTETMNVADFKVTDGGVIIPSEYAETLEKDSVFILPKDSATGDGGAYKVIAKVINSDGTVNVKSVPAKPEEIYENIDVSGKFYADMSTFELSSDSRVTSSTGASPTGMSYNSPGAFIASPLAYNDANSGGIQTMASVGVNSVDFNIDLGNDTKLGLSVKDIALNTDIDWSFGIFKGLSLDRIYMAVDYTTEVSVERTLGEVGDGGLELYESLLGKDYLSEPSIELGKAAVYICPGISVNLRFSVTFEASGKISVSVSTAHTKGFELVGSDFRTINKTTKSAEITLTGEAGVYATLTLALSLDYVVGELDLLSIQLKVGPTLKGEAKLHTEENKDPLFCIDVSGTLKVEVKLVLLEQVMKAFGLEASLTLIDEDLGGWDFHLENFKKVPSCTLEDDDDKEDTTEADTIPVGIFALESSYISLDVGSSAKISVKSLPSGYSASDLKWSSSDPSVVSVDSNGNIKAAGAGTVSITVKTSDGKYTTQCAVMSKANITISDITNDNGYTGVMAA